MLFGTLPFAVFFAVVLVGYHAVSPRWPARKAWLLAASWCFYATWSPQFLALLVTTTAVDYALALRIHRAITTGAPHKGRRLVAVSLVLNLGVLAFFKYGRFLYDSAAAILTLPPPPGLLRLAVPLGISFYTFHSISYVIDTYRGLRSPTRRFADFALYVAFFPQLIAGPISRWGFFGPQLEAPRRIDREQIEAALFLLARGFVKKIVLADMLGGFVDELYAAPITKGQLEVWLGLYAYGFQIYFDFAGYTDIAWGLAGVLGFELPENFRHPYLADSPADFWRRWHISLSTWLRDYLYVPLGGNRRGAARTYVNLLVTMLLGGLWHGAAWTFVLWGAYHAVGLGAHRAWSARGLGMPTWLARLLTLHFVMIGWILFRAGSFETAAAVVRGLVVPRPVSAPFPVGTLALVALGFVSQAAALRIDLTTLWTRLPRTVQGAVYGLVIVLVGMCGTSSSPFIYFEF